MQQKTDLCGFGIFCTFREIYLKVVTSGDGRLYTSIFSAINRRYTEKSPYFYLLYDMSCVISVSKSLFYHNINILSFQQEYFSFIIIIISGYPAFIYKIILLLQVHYYTLICNSISYSYNS